MATTGRSILLLPTLMFPYLSSVASRASNSPATSRLYSRFISVRWRILPLTASFSSAKALASSSSVLLARDNSLSVGLPTVLNGFQRRRQWRRRSFSQVTELSSSGPPSPSNDLLCNNDIRTADGPASISSETLSSTVSEVQSPEQKEALVPNQVTSRKSKRMCYYHSQGLCTMTEDPVHLAKFSHEFPDLSVRGAEMKKVKAQPFQYFLVLDLEGMVEILEFPVVMIDARTLEVVDRFHRFVRPVKMTQERIVDYIRNKYGRWGLDRVWHDTATPFTDVIPEFERWLESHGLWDSQGDSVKMTSAAFVTCGNWDVKTKIPEQCATSEMQLPVYFNEWINLKDVYYNFYKFKASGMLKMMKGLKLHMVGTHHVGLDDAYNIARVLQRMLAHGALVVITAKRKADDPKAVKFTFRFRIK